MATRATPPKATAASVISDAVRFKGLAVYVLAAWGILADGKRVLLHLAPGTKEDTASCRDFLRDLKARGLVDPILEYPHFAGGEAVGVVVIGGYVYRGSAIPELVGRYLFGDYSTGFDAPAGRLFVGTEGAGGSWTMANLMVDGDESGGIEAFLLGFGQDLDGEVYVLTSQVIGPTGTTGRVSKIVPV